MVGGLKRYLDRSAYTVPSLSAVGPMLWGPGWFSAGRRPGRLRSNRRRSSN